MGAVFTLMLTHLTPSAIATWSRGPVRVSLAQRHMATSAVEDHNITVGNSEAAFDTLVQYVMLQRDLINTWPLGSVVTQGCHASVVAIWAHKDHPHTLDYCNPPNLDSMHKARISLVRYQEPRRAPAREVLAEKTQIPKPFDTHNLKSRHSGYDLKILRERCEIPPSIKLRVMCSRGTHGSGGGSRGDPFLFNAQGVLGDIIPIELVSIYGGYDKVQDLDFWALVSKPQPKKLRVEEFVLGLGISKAKEAPKKQKVLTRAGTSSSARFDTPH
ncbi:hypothetical protein RJ639_030300 [Escallonia herrerae]|uniref:Aminoacyl-tRNA hydrolase n=1 Tax=Escallonia herrerae TaxID=1293975 RepID=A0AA88X1K4_9ASTE|nr:hypothetical protein RJ639_030300 [Escallonia herrerae]